MITAERLDRDALVASRASASVSSSRRSTAAMRSTRGSSRRQGFQMERLQFPRDLERLPLTTKRN